MIDVVEATIAGLRSALVSGAASSEDLVTAYLRRIATYDHAGIRLNSVIIMNPTALDEARASDARRARGETLGPLDGIPYTAKDSYKVKGLTVAAGSPAFEHLVAQDDAFTIERLRAGGAVLIGLTNMPPMANGGMQRGVYGRAHSPYNAGYLTAAFASGSSNGSGTATAASFAAFGLAEETWSSGRAPASNNGLCAYTPSWGVISVRGNWPLVPTMDVVVPHTRTMADLLEVLDVIVADDPQTRGDFWRHQPWIPIPPASTLRPDSYTSLEPRDPAAAGAYLAGKRLGVPRMYINEDPAAGTSSSPGIGGPTGQRIVTRDSIIALWQQARGELEQAGAEVVDVEFPVVSNYEGDRPGAPTIRTRGLVSPEYLHHEIVDLAAWAWHDFLQANADPDLASLADVDGQQIFPADPRALPDRYTGFDDDIAEYPDHIRRHGTRDLHAIPYLEEGLHGLQATRRLDLEDWMRDQGLDAIVFPAAADIGPADSDSDPASADIAWRNGVWVSNGNLVPRHLGIPTVTVPMGITADLGMPVGLTFAGTAYSDTDLLRLAAAFERRGAPRRAAPPRTPPLRDAARSVAPVLPEGHVAPGADVLTP
ncbi:amidase [Arthrobacter agilis]|uniref:amidase n=1 Tax=Arthrobacter agilis TaxID=37921 RepID=UPI00277EC54C|nr:amidase [Arthrobacter agilis]MDQ0736470.1 amidase [Arthrobacter agilis]